MSESRGYFHLGLIGCTRMYASKITSVIGLRGFWNLEVYQELICMTTGAFLFVSINKMLGYLNNYKV